MVNKTLAQAAAAHPFPEYQDWWDLGAHFVDFMSRAILAQWRGLPGNQGNLNSVKGHYRAYLQAVYNREADAGLVDRFAGRGHLTPLKSGQFDGLSYAFYRSAFESIQQHPALYSHSVDRERRLFTKRVGQRFFEQISRHLDLRLPAGLQNREDLAHLKGCLQALGGFLTGQGYLRDRFDFRFSLAGMPQDGEIAQTETEFLAILNRGETAHAIYEMGYPVILPSAVYLYQTIGEAQHHSSRTIEELFGQIGFQARESDDFDPGEYASENVVELWEISLRPR